WLPAAVLKAFQQAKAMCLEALEDTAASKVTLPFVEDQLRAAREFMGNDFWSYGLAPNRKVLETFLRHHHAQGLSSRLVSPEELSPPSTHKSFAFWDTRGGGGFPSSGSRAACPGGGPPGSGARPGLRPPLLGPPRPQRSPSRRSAPDRWSWSPGRIQPPLAPCRAPHNRCRDRKCVGRSSGSPAADCAGGRRAPDAAHR